MEECLEFELTYWCIDRFAFLRWTSTFRLRKLVLGISQSMLRFKRWFRVFACSSIISLYCYYGTTTNLSERLLLFIFHHFLRGQRRIPTNYDEFITAWYHLLLMWLESRLFCLQPLLWRLHSRGDEGLFQWSDIYFLCSMQKSNQIKVKQKGDSY